MTTHRLDVDFRGIVNVARPAGRWPQVDRNGRRGSTLASPRRRRQVLFLSSTTPARSWMAASLLSARCGQHAQAWFGSLAPADLPATVTDTVSELAAGAGEPVLHARELTGPPDLVIILGTPFPVESSGMTEVRHWSIADPEGQSPRTVRLIRDVLVTHVQMLAAELSVAA
jgi:protein-tyrosine-phosphatase